MAHRESKAVREAFGPALEFACGHALSYLDCLDTGPVQARGSLESLRHQLHRPLSEHGVSPQEVLTDLVKDTAGGLHGTAGGRAFAYVIGGSLPAALAADWLTSAWDQNAHCFATGPAAAIAEEAVGTWLKDIFGIPASASFALVTGCQMAHVTCLLAARHAMLARYDWDVETAGLAGSPPIRVLASDQIHGSIERAVRFIGLGRNSLRVLPTDSDGRVTAETLSAALGANAGMPVIVILCAGDLNIAAFDPFESLIPLAKQHHAWVHIDGAFGLWAAASPAHRHLLTGAREADSWAADGHKWLNVPHDCGYAFIKDRVAHAQAMSHRALYIAYASDARDEADFNPEWSRRARGFASYAALRQLGLAGLREMIERSCHCALALVERIGRLSAARVLWKPTLNQGLIRFLDHMPGSTHDHHDRRTDEVIARINAAGEAFFSGTTWRGQRAMRVSVCNWQTDDADVDRAVESVADVLETFA